MLYGFETDFIDLRVVAGDNQYRQFESVKEELRDGWKWEEWRSFEEWRRSVNVSLQRPDIKHPNRINVHSSPPTAELTLPATTYCQTMILRLLQQLIRIITHLHNVAWSDRTRRLLGHFVSNGCLFWGCLNPGSAWWDV